jgi:hypothetical protein
MRTDQFIDMLSANLEPADHRKMSRHLRIAVLFGTLGAVGAALLVLGGRRDFIDPHAFVFLGVKLLFAGSAAVLAGIYLMRSARPGGERKNPLAIVLPFVAIMLLAVGSLSLSPGSHWRGMVSQGEWLECLISIPLIAIVPFAALVWAVRQAAPTNLVRTGALVGLVAGSISAMGYALHCMADSFPFIAIWYGATIALCTLAGSWLGPKLLRW